MSKIPRVTFTPFGASAGTDQLEIFGSLAAGSPSYVNPGSAAVAQIQGLSAWLEGWFGAVVGSNGPSIQDMNAFCYVMAYEMSYLFQMGIPEWDSATTYDVNSYVQVAGTIYISLVTNNTGNAPASSPSEWGSPFQPVQQVFTQNGSITIPAGVTKVRLIGQKQKRSTGPNPGSDVWFVSTDNNLYAFGSNFNGELGLGDQTPRSSPVLVLGGYPPLYLETNVGSVGFTTQDGKLFMMGYNANGQLGCGDVNARSSPTQVLGPYRWRNMNSYSGAVAAIDSTGKLYSWGQGQGNIGDGTTSTSYSSPVAVVGTSLPIFVQANPSGLNAFALDINGQVWAWGVNYTNLGPSSLVGYLGTGNINPQSSPVLVAGGHSFAQFYSDPGNVNQFALDGSGNCYAWGTNFSELTFGYGSLGLNNTTVASSPTIMPGVSFASLLVQSAMSGYFGIGLNNQIYGWGDNTYGQIGNGTVNYASTPTMVLGLPGGKTWVKLAATRGGVTVFALASDGTLWGWGSNLDGAFGNTATAAYSSPVQVVGPAGVPGGYVDVFCGINVPNYYAIDANGALYGWGFNVQGQTGSGDTALHSSPIMVVGPYLPVKLGIEQQMWELSVTPGATYAININQPIPQFGTQYLSSTGFGSGPLINLTVEYML